MKLGQSPAQFGFKSKISDGLEQIALRLHGIAGGRVLGGLGNKNYDDRSVHAADRRSGTHPVDALHLNIQEDNVEIGLVILKESGAVLKLPRLILQRVLLRILR